MAIDYLPQSRADDDQYMTAARAYRELLSEPSKPRNGPPLARENFVDQATDIFTTLRESITRGEPRAQAYRRATEVYLNDAEDPRLALQAAIILQAPIIASTERHLEELRVKERQAVIAQEERQQKNEMVVVACTYNRKVRDMILENPQTFTRADLTDWLEHASGGNTAWAQRLMTGIVAEAAVMKVAQEMPGLLVEPGRIEDDLKGIDFVLVRQADGRRRSIDVKAGNGADFSRNTNMDVSLVGVDAASIDDLQIRPDMTLRLRNSLLQLF